jgi:hypothetical protein
MLHAALLTVGLIAIIITAVAFNGIGDFPE